MRDEIKKKVLDRLKTEYACVWEDNENFDKQFANLTIDLTIQETIKRVFDEIEKQKKKSEIKRTKVMIESKMDEYERSARLGEWYLFGLIIQEVKKRLVEEVE